MTAPVRVQLSRAKGWRVPPNTVKVDRTTRWGNPYRVMNAELLHPDHRAAELRAAVEAFRGWLCWEQPQPRMVLHDPPRITEIVAELRGKNLACWCRPGEPCHADVLLALANG